MNKLVAVVGMCGAGKSIATDILEKRGWTKIYFGGVTYQKMAEEGIERTPDSERIFRENLRKKYGPECYARLLHKDIEEALEKGDVVLDGLYSWYEYNYLIENFHNLKMICVVTDKKIRYDRISKRVERPFNNKEAQERDISELENLHKGNPIAYADYFIFNNGTISDYEIRLNDILNDMEGE